MKEYTAIGPKLARVMAHPLRMRALAILDERVASPSEMARELDAPLGVMSYHVRQLERAGLIELVSTTPRRGALEHHFRAVVRPRVTDADWAQLPEIVKQAIVSSGLQGISERVNAAAAQGGFSRENAQLSKTEMVVDDQGWKQVVKELDRLDERLVKIQQESAARIGNDHDRELAASLVYLFFEPAPVEAKPAESRRASRREETARKARRA
jgi:DNA-binding transcriptional ArsR family regulator